MLGLKAGHGADFLHGWIFGAQVFHQGTLSLLDLHQLVGSVQRQPHSPAFFINGLHDGLTNPPNGVTDEVIALVGIELIQSRHQADVSLVDQVNQGYPLILILLGHIHHEAEVGFNHPFAGEFITFLHTLGQCKFLFCTEQRNTVDFFEVHTQDVGIVISIRIFVIVKHGAFRFHCAFSLLGCWKGKCN
ncbi:hypothetical protein DSECCO2_552110 [anaerobic digester metagenome]